MSPRVPQKCSIGIVKGARESGEETIWPKRNGLYWCLSRPFRKKSRSAQLWSPHGDMWQRALRTVHTWALHWEVALWTRTKLPSAHWPKQWWGASIGASKWWLRKGTACCPVFSLTRLLKLAEVPTVTTNQPDSAGLVWNLFSSLAVCAFWSGKLACLIIPTARTHSVIMNCLCFPELKVNVFDH